MKRSIPACAGEPRRLIFRPSRIRVYPRVCGGTGSVYSVHVSEMGLSPRVRGNRDQQIPFLVTHGSIPACAGEPLAIPGNPDTLGVYPRVCGGTMVSGTAKNRYPGLSPRVRGNRWQVDAHSFRDGSIPACAGEPSMKPTAFDSARVYPRVCGGTSPV